MAKAVLLAEDSYDDVVLFLEVMRRSGLRNPVQVVHDGEKAIAYLKGEGEFADRERHPLPAILILDLKMPRVSGFQVLEWINSHSGLKELLVVVLSHHGETSDINRAYALGAHSFLLKPFTQADLVNLAGHFNTHWERTPVRPEL
jgi:CheY-like chemotaxis protein